MGKMKEEYERQIEQRGVLPEEVIGDLKTQIDELKTMITDMQNDIMDIQSDVTRIKHLCDK